jgi:hypothetical protein
MTCFGKCFGLRALGVGQRALRGAGRQGGRGGAASNGGEGQLPATGGGGGCAVIW